MNCFRHPEREALVFCRSCDHPLCRECAEQKFGGQTHVCSEECARAAGRDPELKDEPESLFNKVYASVFLTVLLAVLGGGFIVWGAQSSAASIEISMHGGRSISYLHRPNLFDIFYNCGITDWRAQFGIGAAIGAGCAAVFLVKFYRKEGK